MAACLLVVLATGVAADAAGLSMALGALIAGLLLAETEYRRQIEVTVEPFKGLLLGVFLISVGLSLDLGRVVAAPAGRSWARSWACWRSRRLVTPRLAARLRPAPGASPARPGCCWARAASSASSSWAGQAPGCSARSWRLRLRRRRR